MKTPPLLLGAALLFWGWQTGLLILAAIMALVIEGSRLVKSRLDLSHSDFRRISNLCTFLFMGMVIYLLATNRSPGAILILIQRFPIIFFPLLLGQYYSTSEKIDIGTLFLIFRIRSTYINMTYPYLMLCILSASTANVRTQWFFVGLIVLSVWALWFVRSQRFSPVLWISLLAITGSMGYMGQMGLHNLQVIVEKRAVDWFTDFIREDTDPYRARTAIGDMGTLKLSDRILFRVKPKVRDGKPILLREASYNVYKSSMWFAHQAHFKKIRPEPDGTTWKLGAHQGGDKLITVFDHLRGGKGMLKLPNGVFEITQLPVLKMDMNQFDAVKVAGGPGLIRYQVRFNPYASLDSPPCETDLEVLQNERPIIAKITQELGLTLQSPQEVLKRVHAFFQKKFRYSLALNNGNHQKSITDFLMRSRSGHCEYFATATVLLLRGLGIPARYATGYSVQEFSKMENRFIVRSRHAHAWVLAYMDGAWHNVDTTPSSWINIEEKAASPLEPLYDLWSWCFFKFSEWRWRERAEGGMTKHVWWLLIPLTFVLVRRFYSRSRVRRGEKEPEKKNLTEIQPGADSEFYVVEQRLMEWGYTRYPWETLSDWITRIAETPSSLVSTEQLPSILAFHYRYRFDPKGITGDDKEALTSKVHSWLHQQKEHNGKNL